LIPPFEQNSAQQSVQESTWAQPLVSPTVNAADSAVEAYPSTPPRFTDPVATEAVQFAAPSPYTVNSTDQLIAQENARVGVFENPPAPLPRSRKILAAINEHRSVLLGIVVGLLLLGVGSTFAIASMKKVTGGTVASSTTSKSASSVSGETSSGNAADANGGGDNSDEDTGDEEEDSGSDDEDTGDEEEDSGSDDEDTGDEEEDSGSDDEDTGDDAEDDTGNDAPDPGDDGPDDTVTPAPTPVPTKPVVSTPHKFTVASWNVKTDNTKTVGTEVLSLLTKSQIIGLQTLRTKTMRDSVKSKVICSSCAYSGYLAAYSGSDSGPSDLPIIWDKSAFTIVGSGSSRKMCDAASSKSYSYAARYATWVKLQSKANGKQFYVVDTHTMSPGESGGKPGSDSLLTGRFQTHMTNLKGLIGELQKANVPIYVVGTFNVDYRYDRFGYTSYFPYTSFKSMGVRSSWDLMGLSGVSSSVGTVSGSKRLIDYVFTWQRSDVTANAIAVATSTHGSDHYAVYFTNTIK
jgi:hypothetical protein